MPEAGNTEHRAERDFVGYLVNQKVFDVNKVNFDVDEVDLTLELIVITGSIELCNFQRKENSCAATSWGKLYVS